jgi:hypothetical protein
MPQTNRILTLLAAIGSAGLLWGSPEVTHGDEPDDVAAALDGPALLPSGPAYGSQFPAGSAGAAPAPQSVADDQEKAADEGEDASPNAEEPPEEEPRAVPKPPLSPAMATLRDRVRQTLAVYRRPALSTRENTATDVMQLCLAFGCDSELYHRGTSGGKLNGITCLCWNYPCAGYLPLGPAEGRIAARIGYGRQEHPGQLLAVLALSRVPADYPIRVGEDVRTVADLIEHEKLSCRPATDFSRTLIGLAYYLPSDATWENRLGESWSIARILKEEIAKPVVTEGTRGTDRLMGLSYAVERRAKQDKPIDGEFRRASNYVRKFHDYALSLQNGDGTWGPRLLAARESSRDAATQLRATGHVLRWLVFSLPEAQIEDPRVVRSVAYLNQLLAGKRFRSGLKSLSTRNIESVMHGLHALSIYDQRYFAPRTPEQPTPEPANQTAQRQATRDR